MQGRGGSNPRSEMFSCIKVPNFRSDSNDDSRYLAPSKGGNQGKFSFIMSI